MSIRISFILLMLLAASSCTVEKRLYSRGFHVEFQKRQLPADSHNATSKQLITEIPQIEQLKISSDSITDTSILQEKEVEVVIERTNDEVIPATKPVSRKSKMEITVNKIRTGISIQTHFSESLMSKSLEKDPKKRSKKRDMDIDWEKVLDWVYLFGGLIGLVLLASAMPGVNLGAALVGVLVVVIVIILVALLIASAIGDFEWFWSGR